MPGDWICCQIGAREHYAVPRALHGEGALRQLLTDAWVRPGNPIGTLRRNLRERFDPGLSRAPVKAWTLGLVAFEMMARARKLSGWPLILARNRWFQKRVLQKLKAEIHPARSQMPSSQPSTLNPQPILFSYSYAALEPFRWARQRGWKTVLGQIDPGPGHERIVAKLAQEHREWSPNCQSPPAAYWHAWQQEWRFADVVMVNSQWSLDTLCSEGVPKEKLRVVPVAFEIPHGAIAFRRSYPATFAPARPLRVLFLGQVSLAKGIAATLEAMIELEGQPIELWVVGPRQVQLQERWLRHAQVRWFGRVPRSEVARFYREADVFLFPTFSDGFGLTQLEAQAWKLPVIASRYCGEVVQHGVNGLLLDEVAPAEIAAALRTLARDSTRLADMSLASGLPERFTVGALQSNLRSF